MVSVVMGVIFLSVSLTSPEIEMLLLVLMLRVCVFSCFLFVVFFP